MDEGEGFTLAQWQQGHMPFCKSLVPRLRYRLVMAIVECPSKRCRTKGGAFPVWPHWPHW